MIAAGVDIGTNSMLLLVVDEQHGRLVELSRRIVVTGLGRGVDRTGSLDPTGIERTLAAMAEFGADLRRFGAVRMRAVATSATRDAKDGDTFLDSVAAVLGVRPNVISGTEEAELTFEGAAVGEVRAASSLIVDIGGGSTELVLGADSPEWSVSVDIGSVRLSDRCLPRRPASLEDVAAARDEADRVLAATHLPYRAVGAVGVGGTVTSVAALVLDLPFYEGSAVNGSFVELHAVTVLIAKLAAMSLQETAALPALDPARAYAMLGGAVVLERALHAVEQDGLAVSTRGVVDGIVARLLSEG